MESVAGQSTGTGTPSKRGRRRRNIIPPGLSFSEAIPLSFPQKKRPKLVLTKGERLIIINVFKYVSHTKPEDKYLSNHDLVKKTSEICGVSERSIYRVLSEYRDTNYQYIAEPEPKRSKPNILQKVDDFDKSAIRNIVHSFYRKGELPTLKKIHQALNDDENLPTLSMTSLRRILYHLKFRYIKQNRNSMLIDRRDIVLWRMKYLEQIKLFRDENRRIYYTDETWVNAGHTVEKTWVDPNILKTAKAPVTKEKRLVVFHIGNEDGFIEDCGWIFESSKTGDYYENVDAPHFEEWFSRVLAKLQPNDVVVLDNASYHSRRLERTPTMSWRKDAIQDWLRSKNIHSDADDIKSFLMEKVDAVKNDYQAYVIDEMAKQKGITVLRLPPYHCQLNPIELIWADVRGYVAKNNTTFQFGDVRRWLEEALEQVTPMRWTNSVTHVINEEELMRGLDHSIDKTIDRFVNVTDSDTNSETDIYTDSDTSDTI